MKPADMQKYIISPKKTEALALTEMGSAHAGKIKYKRTQEKKNKNLY